MRSEDGRLEVRRRSSLSNPPAGYDSIGTNSNGRIIAVDSSGNQTWLSKYNKPDFWNAWGHSYFQYIFGTFYQTGRSDAILKAALDIEGGNWRNWAVNGAAVIQQGNYFGGWARVMQEAVRPQRGAPYVSDGGASLVAYGINDIGGFSSLSQAQAQALVKHALRAVISRLRASVFFDNGYSVGTRTTYGSGWTAMTGANDYSSSRGTLRRATSTTSATITLTLPTDFTGQTVVVQFVAEAAAGGSVAFSGTAGATGTLATSGLIPSGAPVKTPVVRRITGLPASAAGKTIIMTMTSVTSQMLFDGWWLEADYPPPIIVANAARVQTAGYSGYANAIGDTDIQNLNANSIVPVVAEFDGMVQLADMDGALNKLPECYGPDGLHPNEKGAGRVAEAFQDAIEALVPTDPVFPTLNMNVSSPRAGYNRRPRISGFWYSVESSQAVSNQVIGTNLSAGEIRWAPFLVTEGREKYIQAGFRVAVAGTSSATIRWGIYDDVAWKGYPGRLIAEIPNVGGGAFTVPRAVGAALNPATGTGSISWAVEPGLYWLAFKIDTAGSGQSLECWTGPDSTGIMPRLNSDMTNLSASPGTGPICFVQGGYAAGALPAVFDASLGLFPNGVFPKFSLLVA